MFPTAVLHVLFDQYGKLVHLPFPDPLLQSTLPPPATEFPARSSTPAQRQLLVTGT